MKSKRSLDLSASSLRQGKDEGLRQEEYYGANNAHSLKTEKKIVIERVINKILLHQKFQVILVHHRMIKRVGCFLSFEKISSVVIAC